MRFDIVGGGSIGLLLAARLSGSTGSVGSAATDTCVTVITRSEEQAGHIRGEGVSLLDPGAERLLISAQPRAASFSSYSREPGFTNADWILVTLKQKDLTADVLEAIGRRCGPSTRVCCFQNGIGHLQKLSKHLPNCRIYAAVTTEGARRRGPVEVSHTGQGLTRLGYPWGDGSEAEAPHVQELADVLTYAGFLAEVSKRIEADIWDKLLINVVVNPLTAIMGIPNGSLLQSEHSLQLMRQLYEEAVHLARALHIDIDPELWSRILNVCRATAANRSSMLQDLDAGRETEIDWLNGSLVREAERVSVSLPIHRAIYALVKCKEQQERLHAGTQ